VGPYVVVNPATWDWDGDFGLARHLSEQRFRQLLFTIFVGVALVNWQKVSDPARKARVSLGQAIVAGVFGWLVSQFFEFPSLTPAGLLAGLALCVNFLAPMQEDLGGTQANATGTKQRVYLERRWQVKQPASGKPPAVSVREQEAAQRESRRTDVPGHGHSHWWLWILLGVFLVYLVARGCDGP
jgi:hypothetical protein